MLCFQTGSLRSTWTKESGVLPSQRLFRKEGGTDGSETDDDISVSPLIWTYLLIEELCQSSDLCLKYPYITASITSGTLRSDTFPKIHRAALCRPSQALLSLAPCSPLYEENSGFIFGMNSRASTFLFPLSLLSQKEAYTVYSKMILFTSVHKALVLM